MRNLYIILVFISTSALGQITVTTVTPTFNGSGGVTIDSTGQVYIGDFGDFLGGPDTDGIPNNVMKLDKDLNLTIVADDFTGASGNEFNSEGILFQADIRDNAVYKIVDGARELYASEGLVLPVGIAFDAEDNLYVCNCGANNIRKITPEGVSTMFFAGNGLLGCPNGMTIDENGNLYVVNFSNPFIVKIEPDGTASNIGNTAAGNGHIDYDLNTNHLYIASFGAHLIYYLDLDDLDEGARIIAGTGVPGNDDGEALSATFSAPNGIAVTKNGDSLYVNSSATLNNANLNPQYVRVLSNVLETLSNDNGTTDVEDVADNIYKTYPNPTTDTFTIESNLSIRTDGLMIRVWDVNGNTVQSINKFNSAQTSKIIIDTSLFPTGVYFYSVKSKEGKLKHGKILKK